MRRSLLPSLLALACACAGPPPEPGTDTAAGENSLPSLSQLSERGLLVPGRSRAALRESLGAPDSVSTRVVPNRHVPGVRDTLFTLYYPGLVAHIHHPGGGEDLLSAMEVSSNRYLRYPELGIGAPRERVLEALGPPDETRDGALSYVCRECSEVEEPIRFHFADGRVSRIRFDYYVD